MKVSIFSGSIRLHILIPKQLNTLFDRTFTVWLGLGEHDGFA